MVAKVSLDAHPGFGLRMRALGHALFYLLLAFLGALIATAIGKALFGASLLELARGGVMAGIARALLLVLGTVVLPLLLVLRLFRESWATTGWRISDGPRFLGLGLAVGFGLALLIAFALWASGAVTFRVAATSPKSALTGLLLSLLLWLSQAAGEEGLNRGYAFVQACRAISFWPAAILSSAGFMLGHSSNAGETVLGLIAAGFFGLELSYSVLRTGSLWFALGFHTAWNFTQSFVFGFHGSGASSPTSWLTADVTGPALLTGGQAGPEGSIFVVPALVLLFVAVHWTGKPSTSKGS